MEATKSYTFRVEGTPRPWKVWARGRAPREAGHDYLVTYQELIAATARNYWIEHGLQIIEGPVSLTFRFYRPITVAAHKRLKDTPMKWVARHLILRPDVTNYQKAAEDALQGIAYRSDSQVVAVTSFKLFERCEQGYTQIEIRPWTWNGRGDT